MKVVDGNRIEVQKKLPHGAVVNGVMWSLFNKDILATGCSDACVRIFDLSKKDSPTLVLKGHTAKAFNVAWNPHFDYILASGSDDKTIRIWDTKSVQVAIPTHREDRNS